MKIPKEIRTYCPSCRKHTLHSVRQVRKRGARALSWGQRQFRRVLAGYGGKPRSEQKKFAKTSKRVNILLTCGECGKSHPREGFRAKRVEIAG